LTGLQRDLEHVLAQTAGGIALSPTEAALVLTCIALASVVPAAPGTLNLGF
jgi:hypothetical protein